MRRNYETRARLLPGCWIVSGPLAAEQIYTALKPLLGDGRLLIVKAATEAVWHGLADTDATWLAENFPGSISERIQSIEEFGRAIEEIADASRFFAKLRKKSR